MKILNVSLDQKVLEKGSTVQQRILEYGKLVDQYTVIVLADKDDFFNLSSNTKVISVCRENKLKGFFNLSSVLKRTLKNEKYDLITVQDVYYIAYLALNLTSKYNLGLEIQVHGFEKFKGIRKSIARYVLKRADAIRTVSQRLKKQLISEFKIKENKITVVPVYVFLDFDPTGRRDPTGRFIFLTVGRLVPVKNIQMQIEAIANLKDKFRNIKLWIVGDGPEMEKLKAQSKKLGLEKIVKFWAWQNDLKKFYQQADCFLLTSNQEGYGMVVVEASTYALPIIMTDVGCAGDFIKNNENGVIIAIKDQKALENNMRELIKNQELRVRLGKNAQSSAKKLLNKEETLNLYQKSWRKAIK